jgi:anti-sigma regulatory factor (Ser/Thr protein kinase)
VDFYDSDQALVRSVGEFLRPAFDEGTAIVVAREGHASAVTAAVGSLIAPERLVVLDAQETLDAFLVDDMPVATRFHRVMRPLLAGAAGPVRIFGEMVAVLWEQGNVLAAVELEKLWNGLAIEHPFALLCGYPTALFRHEDAAGQFQTLCEQHATVTITPDPDNTWMAAAAARACATKDPHVRWKFPAAVTSGARARRQLRELLALWDLGDLLDDAELLATELVNNAVVHALSDVTLSVSRRPAALRVEVTDVGPGMLLPSQPGTEATHGRGLMLVDTLSAAWGTAISDESKTVWFELPAAATA